MTAPDTIHTTWYVRVVGSDDWIPALNRLDAHERAHKVNEAAVHIAGTSPSPYAPLIWAFPTEAGPSVHSVAEIDAMWAEYLSPKSPEYPDEYYVIGRDSDGNVRADSGRALLIARPEDSAERVRSWVKTAANEHKRRLYTAAADFIEGGA